MSSATIAEPSAVISTHQLCKSFALRDNVQHVLVDVDLEIFAGQFTVIMGPSGAGKSTLMYTLSGMDQPTSGSIVFDGENISSYSPDRLARFRRGHCGFVFQQIYLLDWLTVMDNTLAVGMLRDTSRRELVERANRLFDMVGIEPDSRTKFPAMLSGGESQRAAIVRGLILSPDLLFADEPTGQLNSRSSQAVLDLLTEVNASGQAVVMVTHDVRSALRGDRILYLRDGAIKGELNLPAWDPEDDTRHEKVTGFLTGLGW